MANYVIEKLKTFKLPLIVISIVTLVLDLVAFLLLCVFQYEFKYILYPIFSLVVDALFILAVFNTNYRFKYSKASYVLYIITTIILSAIPFFTINVFGTTAIFTTISGLILIISHVLLMIGVAYSVKVASKPSDTTPKFIPMTFSTILVAMCIVTIAFVISNGYFGQGNESRTIVYEFDQETQTYSAVNVLGGKGDTVIIPEQFNGYDVNKIDLHLFTRDDFSNVVINTKNFILTNEYGIKDINSTLKISICKEKYDYFKNALYSTKGEGYIYLANNTKPIVSENEVYVTFAYSQEELEVFSYKPLPTWFGSKGDTFDMSSYSNYNYLNHMNSNSVDDLYWCYSNLNSFMLKPFATPDGQLVGKEITEGVDSVDIELIDIYCLKLEDDNDNMYEISEEDKTSYLSDGTSLGYLLSTYDNLVNVNDKISDREGFTLHFDSSLNSYTSLTEAFSINSNKKSLTLTPVWSLDAPNISGLVVNGSAVNLNTKLNFTYGDNLSISPNIDQMISGINLEFMWKKLGSIVSLENTYQEALRNVGDNQVYVLKIKASSNTITSLSSSTTYNFTYDVNKKDLNFTWYLNDNGSVTNVEDVVYDGTNKQIYVTYTGNIDGDDVSYVLTNKYGENAELIYYNDVVSDTLRIVLQGETAECYKIASSSASFKNFKVSARPVTIDVDSATSVYGEDLEQLTCNITHGTLVNNHSLSQVVSIGYKEGLTKLSNVGSYDVVTEVLNNNYNVTFTNDKNAYTITPRPVTITLNNKSSIYGDDIIDLTSTIESGTLVDSASNVYTVSTQVTSKSNIGSYAITGKSINTNYDITFNNATYTLSARPITVLIGNNTSVYGDTLSALVATVTTGTLVDTASNVYKLSTTATNKSNVGDYYIKGTQVNGNYDITFIDGTYTIETRPVTIAVTNRDSVYGDNISTLTATVKSGTLVDSASSVYSLSTTASNTADVGEYTITGTSINTNYAITFESGTYTIKVRPITISIDNKSSVYGDEIVGLTARITSGKLVNSDSASSVFSLATQATKTSDTGNYDIIGTGLDTNYIITFVKGTYAITPRSITVTIDNKTSVYGNDTVEITSQITSGKLVNNDVEGDVYRISTTVSKTSDAGNYEIKGTKLDTNYNITFEKGTYTITPRAITVSIVDKTSVYGDAIVPLTATITSGNLVNNDVEANVYSVITTATNKSSASTYSIKGKVLDTNYNITFIDGTYTITPRAITVTIDDKSSVYGNTIAQLTARVTSGNLVNNDTNVYSLSTTASNKSSVGTYEIKGTVNNTSYSVTFVNGTYTISARNLTNVNSSSVNCEYDGQAHKISVSAQALNTTPVITYSLEENGAYSSNELTFTEVGTYVVYYEITAANHNTVRGSETVTITVKDSK